MSSSQITSRTMEELFENAVKPAQLMQMQRQSGPVFSRANDVNSFNRRNPTAQNALLGIAQTFRANSIKQMYHSASEYSGSYVKLLAEYRCLPLLERKELPPVFLYQFVEVLEGLVDYEHVIAELPGISYSQISSALGFLQRIAQFNTAGVDVDEVEHRYLAQDEELIAGLRRAISEGEPTHVFTPG